MKGGESILRSGSVRLSSSSSVDDEGYSGRGSSGAGSGNSVHMADHLYFRSEGVPSPAGNHVSGSNSSKLIDVAGSSSWGLKMNGKADFDLLAAGSPKCEGGEDGFIQDLDGKMRWQDFYIQCLEDTLECYMKALADYQIENSKLKLEILKREQQLERANRRLGAKEKTSPSGSGIVGAVAANSGCAVTVKKERDATTLEIRRPGKRPSEKRTSTGPLTVGGKTPTGKAGCLPTGAKSLLEDGLKPAEPVPALVPKEEPPPVLEEREAVLKDYLARHSRAMKSPSPSQLDPPPSPALPCRPYLSPGKPSSSNSAFLPSVRDMYKEWEPVRPPCRSRRSQGSSIRMDPFALTTYEISDDELFKMCARGELEEKRRIRWDLQSKRALSKSRPEFETAGEEDDESSDLSEKIKQENLEEEEEQKEPGGKKAKICPAPGSGPGPSSSSKSKNSKRRVRIQQPPPESDPLESVVYLFGPDVD